MAFYDFKRIKEEVVKGDFKMEPNMSFEGFFGLSYPKIVKVIFNNPATVVFWSDGSKTVVKASVEEETFDPEKGLAMAISKKVMGDGYYRQIKKWTEESKNHCENKKSETDSVIEKFRDAVDALAIVASKIYIPSFFGD